MRRALAASAALGLVLAACGGGGGPQLSKAEYVRRGDAICQRYADRIAALGRPDKLTQIAPYIAKALPILSETVDRLGALHPPQELEGAYGRYMSLARATRKRAFDLRNAAARADGPAVQKLLGDAARSAGQGAVLARRAGLDACALS